MSASLKVRKLTQAELAERVETTPGYVNSVLTGRKSASPRWCNLVAEALFLNSEERHKLHYAAAKDAGFELDLTLPKDS